MKWDNQSAFVYVKAKPGKAQQVYQKLQQNAKMLACFMVPGAYDVMVWFDSKDMNDVYQWVSEMRNQGQVEKTCTYPTFQGYWNGKPYQNKKYYGWIKMRSNDFNAAYDDACKYQGVSFCASVAGDYDCFALVCADDYDQFNNYQMEFKNKGYDIDFFVPFQGYWNPKADAAWQNYEKNTYAPAR